MRALAKIAFDAKRGQERELIMFVTEFCSYFLYTKVSKVYILVSAKQRKIEDNYGPGPTYDLHIFLRIKHF